MTDTPHSPMTEEESIVKNLTGLGFPQLAISWLLDLWFCFQIFDDIVDEDKEISRTDKDSLIVTSLVNMHRNPWFDEHRFELWPIVANAVYQWKASDTLERTGVSPEKCFMWRASWYSVVLYVLSLTRPSGKTLEQAHAVLQLYGASYPDYLKEIGGWNS